MEIRTEQHLDPEPSPEVSKTRPKNDTLKEVVSNADESLRLFESNFLEKLTKVHPVTPLVIFVPVMVVLMWKNYSVFNQSLASVVSLFGGGLLFWTLFEYTLHRFIFHFEPEGDGFLKRLHFLFHGIHHAYPRDSWRLVMPPAVSIPLAAIVYFLCQAIVPEAILPSFFSGFIFGYLCYDMAHYAIHHLNSSNPIFLSIKKHHYRHHYNNMTKGYGVSSPLWDHIFGSID